MLYLTFAIICSASIALIFKHTENTDSNRYLITSANYFIAFVTSLFMIFSKGLLSGITPEMSFVEDFRQLSSNGLHVLSAYSSIIWGLIVGGVSGFFFFLSFIYYQKSVKENGVGISGTIAKLGILIPMIFSIIIWKELPSVLQWIGIALSLISILIVNLSPKSLERIDINLDSNKREKAFFDYPLGMRKSLACFCEYQNQAYPLKKHQLDILTDRDPKLLRDYTL